MKQGDTGPASVDARHRGNKNRKKYMQYASVMSWRGTVRISEIDQTADLDLN